MNIESTTIFAELDKLTESNDNTDFAMPDTGVEINSTSDYEVEDI